MSGSVYRVREIYTFLISDPFGAKVGSIWVVRAGEAQRSEGSVRLGSLGRWSWVDGGHPALSSQPLREVHLHWVDCDSERRVIPIHLGLLGSLGLLGEVLVGDPDPVHAHGHDEH